MTDSAANPTPFARESTGAVTGEMVIAAGHAYAKAYARPHGATGLFSDDIRRMLEAVVPSALAERDREIELLRSLFKFEDADDVMKSMPNNIHTADGVVVKRSYFDGMIRERGQLKTELAQSARESAGALTDEMKRAARDAYKDETDFPYSSTALYRALEAALPLALAQSRRENFALAATQCEDPVAHEGGSMVCGVVQKLRAQLAQSEAAMDGKRAPSLFQRGEFKLHSGETSSWKIDCDALTDVDIETLAAMIAERAKFNRVIGVPTGGDRLARALEKHISSDGPILIVDDVLTTGKSMEEMRAHYPNAIGVVIFARGPCPSWITPLFSMSAPSRAEADVEAAAKRDYQAHIAGDEENNPSWDKLPDKCQERWRSGDAQRSLLRQKANRKDGDANGLHTHGGRVDAQPRSTADAGSGVVPNSGLCAAINNMADAIRDAAFMFKVSDDDLGYDIEKHRLVLTEPSRAQSGTEEMGK